MYLKATHKILVKLTPDWAKFRHLGYFFYATNFHPNKQFQPVQCDQKAAKISTSKLNLKAQNIHTKLLLKPYDKPQVETSCLGEN